MQILVVSEFVDVFSDEVPTLFPAKEVEFAIDFVTNTVPISRALYQMTLLIV